MYKKILEIPKSAFIFQTQDFCEKLLPCIHEANAW